MDECTYFICGNTWDLNTLWLCVLNKKNDFKDFETSFLLTFNLFKLHSLTFSKCFIMLHVFRKVLNQIFFSFFFSFSLFQLELCASNFCKNYGIWHSDMAVLYGNDAFPILVLSTRKKYSSFLKEFFIFQKICFKVKVLKMFKAFTYCP